MTEQNIIKKGEKMNSIEDTDILKALLPQGSKSVYNLETELKKNNVKANYPTLRRKIKKLTSSGLIDAKEGIKKNGKTDRRDTKNLDVNLKGLVYLIQKGNLNEHEIQQIINRLLSSPQFQTFNIIKAQIGRGVLVRALKRSFCQIRPRTNLEFFDREYASSLIGSLMLNNLADEIVRLRTNPPQKRLRLSHAKAFQDLNRVLNPANIEFLSNWRNSLEKERDSIDQRIAWIDDVLSYGKEGVKP